MSNGKRNTASPFVGGITTDMLKKGGIALEIEIRYNAGMRAYLQNGDRVEGNINHPDARKNLAIPILWEKLREYQDEQRKKGEPIKLTLETYPEWNRRTYNDFYFGMPRGTNHPMIVVISSGLAHIIPNKVGRFTNFRWKPSHKPTNHV